MSFETAQAIAYTLAAWLVLIILVLGILFLWRVW